jgi:hypothetical protein
VVETEMPAPQHALVADRRCVVGGCPEGHAKKSNLVISSLPMRPPAAALAQPHRAATPCSRWQLNRLRRFRCSLSSRAGGRSPQVGTPYPVPDARMIIALVGPARSTDAPRRPTRPSDGERSVTRRAHRKSSAQSRIRGATPLRPHRLRTASIHWRLIRRNAVQGARAAFTRAMRTGPSWRRRRYGRKQNPGPA